MRTFYILMLLLPFSVFGQTRIGIAATVSQLDTLYPGQAAAYQLVTGGTTPGDWGPAKLFRWDSTSTAATNPIVRGTRTAVGRWIHDWDGDVRAFGAIPYQPRATLVPWGTKATNSAIGTNAFSVWIRTTIPSAYTQPHGLFSMGRVPSTNQVTELASSFSLRASPDVWGFLIRGNDGSSGVGSTVAEAALVDTTPSALSNYLGQVVDIVFTRSYTNVAVYFNGTDVTSLFTVSNPLGWSKSVALGEQVFTQVRNNENIWYWPKPTTRFAIWASALTGGQAANPSSVGGKVFDYTPTDTTEPADTSDALNAVSDYLATKGGGVAYFPPGVYRIDKPVRIGKQAHWKGAGSSAYPSTFRQGFRPSATTLAPWFGATNSIFIGDQTQSGEVCLTARALSTLGNALVSSRWIRSTLSDFTMCGDLAGSSEGIWLDRVAGVTIRNVSSRNLPGSPIRAYAVNALQIVNCDGVLGSGLHLRAVADVVCEGNFFDGAKGPGLWMVGNLSRVVHSVFEYGNNPRTSVPAYEWVTSVNDSTDEFTVASSYGHRLRTGQVIRFDANSGVLPDPVSSSNVYYVVVTGPNTFKISSQYADEVSLTGAVYGNNFVDITTPGSGTWYSGAGQSVGMILTGDHNSFANNQSQNNYEGGMRIEGPGGNNSFTANQWIMNGLGNPSASTIPAVELIASSYNSFIGNQVDDRDLAGYSQVGFKLDADSDANLFIANSSNINTPVDSADPDNQFILDFSGIMGSWNGTFGNMYVPSRAGFSGWDPRDYVDSAAITYDRTSKKLYLSSGTTISDTNWFYAPFAPLSGPLYWSLSSGTLSAVNNGTGQAVRTVSSTYHSNLDLLQVNDGSSLGNGVDLKYIRNYGTNSSDYAALPAYAKIGAIIWGGWFGNTSGDSGNSASVSAWSDATPWNSTNRASQVNVEVTPNGSSSRLAAITFQAQASPSVGDTMLLLTYFNGTNWVASSKRVSFGTNDSAGTGYKVLKVSN